MARTSDRQTTVERLLADDIAASEVLASQLRRILDIASSASMGGAFAKDAKTFYLSLKKIWEQSDSRLEAYKEVEDAVSYLDGFLMPLLDSERFDAAVRVGQTFLRRYPGGSALASQPPSDPAYIDYALRAFTGTFEEVDDALVAAFSVPDVPPRVANLVVGVVVLCTVPIWAIYHHFHGTAAYAAVSHQLADVLAAGRTTVRMFHQGLVRQVAAGQNFTTDEEYLLVTVISVLHSMINVRLAYLAQFERDTSSLPPRIRFTADALDQQMRRTAFWVSGPPGERVVQLGRPREPNLEAKPFPYHGSIVYEGGERLHSRSFYALPDGWAVFEDFCRLVCQAGFTVTVTACGNAFGGRHPPHDTHRSGLEFDVDWAFTSDSRDRVRNLARRRKRYGTGIFRDVERDKYFSLEEIPGDKTPPTHIYIEALSALVAFQAAALSGLRRYLYVDVENMILAADYLGWIVDRALFAEVGRKANIPVIEGLGHFNHLHGEVPSPAVSRIDSEVLTRVFVQALIRDKNPDFSSYYLRAPVGASPASVDRVRRFGELWAQRSVDGLPALRPVWLPAEEVRLRLFNE